jgi:hypothetical protein
MTAPKFPGPDATAAEISIWHENEAKRRRSERAREANRSVNRTCSSCLQTGHRRGDRVCENYNDREKRWSDARAEAKS